MVIEVLQILLCTAVLTEMLSKFLTMKMFQLLMEIRQYPNLKFSVMLQGNFRKSEKLDSKQEVLVYSVSQHR